MASLPWQSNAFAKSGMFSRAPEARNRGSGCGSTVVIMRSYSGLAVVLHIRAKERKNRCSAAKPSILAGSGFPASVRSKAMCAIVRPPRSAMLSPSTSLPFSCKSSTTTKESNCFSTQAVRSLKFFRSSGVHQLCRLPCASYCAP